MQFPPRSTTISSSFWIVVPAGDMPDICKHKFGTSKPFNVYDRELADDGSILTDADTEFVGVPLGENDIVEVSLNMVPDELPCGIVAV
jgi:hypothetical protein